MRPASVPLPIAYSGYSYSCSITLYKNKARTEEAELAGYKMALSINGNVIPIEQTNAKAHFSMTKAETAALKNRNNYILSIETDNGSEAYPISYGIFICETL